jgi:hypothetical protein
MIIFLKSRRKVLRRGITKLLCNGGDASASVIKDDGRSRHTRGSLTLPFKPHNTQILYLSLLLAYFFVKFEKIIRASLH